MSAENEAISVYSPHAARRAHRDRSGRLLVVRPRLPPGDALSSRWCRSPPVSDGCSDRSFSRPSLRTHPECPRRPAASVMLLDGTHGLTPPAHRPAGDAAGRLVSGRPDQPVRVPRYLARNIAEAVGICAGSRISRSTSWSRPAPIWWQGFGVIRWGATGPRLRPHRRKGAGLVDAETSMIEEINGADAELVEALAVRGGGPYGPMAGHRHRSRGLRSASGGRDSADRV